MSSKVQIYSLAASALLLVKEFTDITTDKSNEARVFNLHWNSAFNSTLQDLDLDATMIPITLELIADLGQSEYFRYVYKYPTSCVFLRRIKSNAITDNARTHIEKKVGIYQGQKVIFTNEVEAVAECISKDIPLASLNPMAELAVAYKLAMLSLPLIVGKGSKTLKEDLKESYRIAKAEAQEADSLENFNFEPEHIRSEFVQARLE